MTPVVTPAMTALVRRATGCDEMQVQGLASGGNNRVFRVDTGGKPWLLKAYFRHPDDTRDRLGAEYAFSRFAWNRGIRCVPQPVDCDPEHALGLYEYVVGRPPAAQDIAEPAVSAALGFWKALNAHRDHDEARQLPNASESCFTLDEHVRCLRRRIDTLRSMQGGPGLQDEAREFATTALSGAAIRSIDAAIGQARTMGISTDRPLTLSQRCISPSDFGFHNALLSTSGELRFLDFEYAGWDDPAKMVCDFFCQPAVPVPLQFFDAFVEMVSAPLGQSEDCRRRVQMLMPLYRLKWCCIILNDFLPVGARRRRFAREGMATDERKSQQLQKARAALAQALEWR